MKIGRGKRTVSPAILVRTALRPGLSNLDLATCPTSSGLSGCHNLQLDNS